MTAGRLKSAGRHAEYTGIGCWAYRGWGKPGRASEALLTLQLTLDHAAPTQAAAGDRPVKQARRPPAGWRVQNLPQGDRNVGHGGQIF